MVSVPPPLDAIASRALTARLTITCSSWPGSARTGPRSRPCLTTSCDRLAEQPLQQVRHFRDHVGQLEHLRAQRLLAREGEQLAGQAGGAVRVGLDLLDVVIVAVARRVAHQHQVAMADDRGQDVVEVVRDAAGELADRLHLGRLRDLPLELGFLAIVLEQQQHRGIAEPAQAGDGQRDRLVGWRVSRTGKVARHGRAARIAAHRVGDRRLVLLDDEVAGIDRHRPALDARRPTRNALFIVRKRPSRSTSARPSGSMSSSAWTFGSSWLDASEPSNSRKVPAPFGCAGSTGTWTTRSGAAVSPSASRRNWPSSPTLDELGEARRCPRHGSPRMARSANSLLAARTLPSPSTTAASTPAARQPLAGRARRCAWTASASGSAAARLGKRHSSRSLREPDALDLDRRRAGQRRDAGDAAGAVAPGHRRAQSQRLVRLFVAPRSLSGGHRRSASR